MPEKEGAEEKTTKSVVNKKQKQMMGEEGYDVARDEGRVRPSKDKKDATSYPVSDEMKKTQKVNKGPSALDIVKKKYKGQIMDIKKEELDLTQVAETFGGYLIEQDPRKTYKQLKFGFSPNEPIRINDKNFQDLKDMVSGRKTSDDLDLTRKGQNRKPFDPVSKPRKPFDPVPEPKKGFSRPIKKPVKVTQGLGQVEPFDLDLKPKSTGTSAGRSTYASRGKFADRQKGLDKFIDLRKQKKLQNLKKSFKTFRKMPALQQLKTVGQGIGRGVGSMSKATAKVARNLTKGGFKSVGKGLAKKTIGRALGKGLAKQIPGLGQILSGGEAIMRFAKGDVIGGALSTLEMIPGLGLLAGTANVARDVRRATTVARNIKKLKPLTKNMKLVKGMPGAKTLKDIASPYGKVGTFLRKNKLKTALGAGGLALGADAIGDRMRRPNIKPSTPQGGMVGRRSAGSFTAA